MKQHIKSILNSKILSSLRKTMFEGKAFIAMLHRIAPYDDSKILANENMKVSPEFLESFIVNMKNRGYRFITIDELVDSLLSNSLQNKSICITIDDGYKDNFEYGFKIFSKHQVPFCIYLCATFLEKTADMWWFGLEDFLLKHNKIQIKNKELKIDTIQSKNNTFLQIRDILINEINDYGNALEIMKKYAISYDPSTYHNLALDVSEIKNMMGGGC